MFLFSKISRVNLKTTTNKTQQKNNFNTVSANLNSQNEWVDHNNKVANSTLYPLAHSWYNGDNIVGKSRNFMPYVGGVANYKNICVS